MTIVPTTNEFKVGPEAFKLQDDETEARSFSRLLVSNRVVPDFHVEGLSSLSSSRILIILFWQAARFESIVANCGGPYKSVIPLLAQPAGGETPLFVQEFF